MDKGIERIAFEFWAGVGSMKELEAWAEAELRKDEPHPDACEIFNLNYEESEKIALQIAGDIYGFSPVSEKSESWAEELLFTYCEKLLKGQIKPMEFCRLVQNFDSGFLDARPMPKGVAYYPKWLGDLWNCCDWCDESWEKENSPHLIEEVRKILKKRT